MTEAEAQSWKWRALDAELLAWNLKLSLKQEILRAEMLQAEVRELRLRALGDRTCAIPLGRS